VNYEKKQGAFYETPCINQQMMLSNY